ncbi:MAG: transposase family protein [Candidatus Accumulibacter sp.]|uniref:Transposase family protein n=1 Tax=Candidatus Accumulibacter affinis TaxID=2954384 RepID=A0A935W472_9PROT|nr:transposase family protein [Candidatus Accumulibacter affinis]
MLGQLEQIPDPRDPRKRRHKLTALLLYGLLMFVFQFSSRRETNREISRPQFMTTLQLLFPEIDTLPHADTLFRLLRDIDLEHLEQAHVDLIKRLIRGKSFRRYLINRCYPIAIDGSQKLAGDTLWAEELLQRTVGKEETRHTQYFVTSSRPVSPSTTVWSSRCSASSSNTRWAIAKRKSRMASCAALCA